jgi:hypothetical protein
MKSWVQTPVLKKKKSIPINFRNKKRNLFNIIVNKFVKAINQGKEKLKLKKKNYYAHIIILHLENSKDQI